MTAPIWLVPYDFSSASRAAATLAGEEATEKEGAVVLLHTFVEPHVPGSYKWARSEGFADRESLYSALIDEIQGSLDEVARDLREKHDGLHVETIVNRGDPREQIVSTADEQGAFRIVMGTHSRTGLDRYLLGSVMEDVVRHTRVPVTVVKGDGADEEE